MNFDIINLLFWLVVLVFIINKILSALWEIITELIDLVSNNLISIQKIKYIEDKLLELDTVDRVVFYHYHNSGGEISKYSPLRVTALWGNSENMEKLNNLNIDYNYTSLLIKAKEEGYVDFYTQKANDCFLKNLYEKEGINYSRIYHIGHKRKNKNLLCKWLGIHRKTGIFFFSVASKDGEVSEKDFTIIEHYVKKLKEIYKT